MFSLFAIHSLSWWGEPHDAIGRMAEEMLTSDQLKYINKVLLTYKSETGGLHEVANWHDNLKPIGMPLMVPWHFRNQPIVAKNFTLKVYKDSFNVTTINRYCLDAIYDKSTTNLWVLNFCFRSLTHFVGDAHCPVHAAGFWSETFPEGDKGATSQKNVCSIEKYGNDVCKNLHMLWDSACLDYQTYPVPDNKLDEFKKNYSSLWKEFPPKENFGSFADSLDPEVWETDAYAVSKEYVYGKLPDTGKIDQDQYFREGAAAAKKLISVGGYRLGHVFKHFFEVRGNDLPEVEQSRSIVSEIIAWIIDGILFIIATIYTILLIRSNIGGFAFSPLIDS